MKEFPSCFGESGVQVAGSSSMKAPAHENIVTRVYHYSSQRFSGFITVTWIKHVMAQGLNIRIESSANEPLCKLDIKPWLFSKKKGARNMALNNSTKVGIHWDISSAKFGSSPEPLHGYYLKISINEELCVLLGDLQDPSPLLPKANYIAKREHVFGKGLYSSKVQFHNKGKSHDVRVEYDPSDSLDKCLAIYVDGDAVLRVTRLVWKFRGNRNIVVDGVSIEVYWDVYNWLFGGATACDAVFLFRSDVSREKAGWDRSKHVVGSQQGCGFSLVFVCLEG